METSLFKLNENLSISSLKEAVHTHIIKIKAITNLSSWYVTTNEVEHHVLHGALWVLEDYLRDLQMLCESLSEFAS